MLSPYTKTVSLYELFPESTDKLMQPFKDVIEPDIQSGIYLDFEIDDRKHKNKINPILRLARPEDAREIIEIYKELYDGTYPYKEMEDETEVRKMIEDPSIQWIVYQDPSFNIAGCITFVLDFKNKRGYIRGFLLRKEYQGYIDITKAMIGSMIGMCHKYKDKIYTWYVENRTAHAKSQYSMWVCGIAPIGFYPNKDIFFGKVESDLMQIFYDERALRKYRRKDIPNFLPAVERCFTFSNKRYNLGSYEIKVPEISLDDNKISKIRNHLSVKFSTDKFGYITIAFSIENSDSYFKFLYTPTVQNFEKTVYKIANLEELYVFVQEFIKYRKKLKVRYCEVFISAYEPTHQKIFHDAGLVPCGYIPSWRFDYKTDFFEDCILFNYYEGEISENIQIIQEAEELLKILNLTPSNTEKQNNVQKSKFRVINRLGSNSLPKIMKSCLSFCIIGFLFLLVSSIFVAQISVDFKYEIWNHAVSKLGSRIFTPFPSIFDSSCILAGLTSLPFYVFLKNKFKNIKSINLHSRINHELLRCGVVSGVIGGLGYFFVGIFSLDRSGPDSILHNLFAGCTFGGFVFSIFFFSLYIIFFNNKVPKMCGIFGLFSPIIIFILYCILLLPILEWILLLTILVFLVPLTFWTFLK